jgi:hypothetical protein
VRRELRALKRERREGPRCGAKTRTGAPCKRRPAMGRVRCPSHGGCVPTARRSPLAARG